VWGMNFKIMPELDWRYGYVYAWILMLLVGGAVYWFFRKKKWY
jgi:magnesium transporter